jgi:hypothetical protein
LLKSLERKATGAAGILCGSLLDDQLAYAIKSKWRFVDPVRPQNEDADRKQLNDSVGTALQEFIREGGGALTFGLKIDLAFLTRMIGAKTHADLTIIKKIRNKFAHATLVKDSRHAMQPVTFKTQAIESLCNNLTVIKAMSATKSVQGTKTSLPMETPRDKLTVATVIYATSLLVCADVPEAALQRLLDR